MTIAYVMVKLPYGKQETFIIPEIKEVLRLGHKVLLFPCRPDKSIFHMEAEDLKGITYRVGLFSVKVFIGFCLELLRQPFKSVNIITRVIFGSRNPMLIIKNLSVIPKSFYAAKLFRKAKIEHIHAHWASTPSSIAYVSSYLTNIPWSFTAHRWDIVENNILKEKVANATFVRVIDENGKKQIMDVVNDTSLSKKVVTIHMGVNVPENNQVRRGKKDLFTIICPANLVAVKGHQYLIDACKHMVDKGMKFKCFIAGDGLLKDTLKASVQFKNLETCIEFLGRLPHEKLLELYREKMIDLVVLPSIVTEEGEKEGIPVALMEAMAYGIPVISTDTGGIPELVNGVGILISQRNAVQLAHAIENLMMDITNSEDLQRLGKEKIKTEFDIQKNVKMLLKKMKESSLSIH